MARESTYLVFCLTLLALGWAVVGGLAVVGLGGVDWIGRCWIAIVGLHRWVGRLDSLVAIVGLAIRYWPIGRWVFLDWPSESVTCQTLGVRHVLLKSQFVINR